jgi:hypothetical protein
MSNMIQLEQGMDKCAELFVEKLNELAKGKNVVDLAEWVQW